MKRLEYIDILRGISIIGVVLIHVISILGGVEAGSMAYCLSWTNSLLCPYVLRLYGSNSVAERQRTEYP